MSRVELLLCVLAVLTLRHEVVSAGVQRGRAVPYKPARPPSGGPLLSSGQAGSSRWAQSGLSGASGSSGLSGVAIQSPAALAELLTVLNEREERDAASQRPESGELQLLVPIVMVSDDAPRGASAGLSGSGLSGYSGLSGSSLSGLAGVKGSDLYGSGVSGVNAPGVSAYSGLSGLIGGDVDESSSSEVRGSGPLKSADLLPRLLAALSPPATPPRLVHTHSPDTCPTCQLLHAIQDQAALAALNGLSDSRDSRDWRDSRDVRDPLDSRDSRESLERMGVRVGSQPVCIVQVARRAGDPPAPDQSDKSNGPKDVLPK